MLQAELQVKIRHLHNAIAEHQQVIQFLQLQREELTTPPAIPPGATGQQMAEIFESRSGFDDQLLGLSAALGELNRRLNHLLGELASATQQLRQHREQERDNLLTAKIFAEINI